ncbi:MAG: hypothetical protein ACRCYY_08105 [Trueperaceae bacterium]
MMKRFLPLLFTFYFLLFTFSVVSAQETGQGTGTQDAQPSGGTASDEVSIKTEIFVVNQTTGADGQVVEDTRPATTARPGQTVEYRLIAKNETDTTLPAGTVVITGPVPDGLTYIAKSATPKDERILTEYSADGTNFVEAEAEQAYKAVRWSLLVPLEPGQEETFVYRVTVNQVE